MALGLGARMHFFNNLTPERMGLDQDIGGATPERLSVSVSANLFEGGGRSLAMFNKVSSSSIVMGSIFKDGVDGSIENLSGEIDPSTVLLSGSILFGSAQRNGLTCHGGTGGGDRRRLHASCGTV